MSLRATHHSRCAAWCAALVVLLTFAAGAFGADPVRLPIGSKVIKHQYGYVSFGPPFGFIDGTGKIVIPHQWDKVFPFTDGLAEVQQGDKWGFIDTTGKLVIPLQWDSTCGFVGGLASVGRGGKQGYIDREGGVAVPIEWDGAQDTRVGTKGPTYRASSNKPPPTKPSPSGSGRT